MLLTCSVIGILIALLTAESRKAILELPDVGALILAGGLAGYGTGAITTGYSVPAVIAITVVASLVAVTGVAIARLGRKGIW